MHRKVILKYENLHITYGYNTSKFIYVMDLL